MSFVTSRVTHERTAATYTINVEDFSTVGIYFRTSAAATNSVQPGIIGTGGIAFIPSAAATAVNTVTANVPVFHEIDVKGFNVLRVILGTSQAGTNGVYVLGTVNKVTNF